MATNYKAQVAEALFDSSVKISREALLWTMSNLPDGENKGSYSSGKLAVEKNFDHEQENIWSAIGITEEDAKKLSSVMAKELSKIKEPDGRISKIVEGVMNAIEEHPELLKLIVVKTVQDALDFAEGAGDIDKMIKMMKLIEKLKKKE